LYIFSIHNAGMLNRCDVVNGNALEVPNDTCVDITGVTPGLDTICVVVCDLESPDKCDTTIIIVTVTPPVDTIEITIPEGSMMTVCPDIFNIPNPGMLTICDPGNGNASEVPNDTCVDITGVTPGLDTICVVVCDLESPDECDTTIIIVTVTPPVDMECSGGQDRPN